MGAHVLSVRTFLMHGVFAPCTVTRFAIWITGSLSGSGKWPLRPCRDNPIQSCRQALPPGGLLGYRESTQRTHLRGLQDYRDDCETRGGVGLPATVFDREAYVVYSIHERTAFQLRVAARSTERRIRIPPPPDHRRRGLCCLQNPSEADAALGAYRALDVEAEDAHFRQRLELPLRFMSH
jgi:hypothetical protein